MPNDFCLVFLVQRYDVSGKNASFFLIRFVNFSSINKNVAQIVVVLLTICATKSVNHSTFAKSEGCHSLLFSRQNLADVGKFVEALDGSEVIEVKFEDFVTYLRENGIVELEE